MGDHGVAVQEAGAAYRGPARRQDTRIAAAGHSPFVAAADPRMFRLDSYEQLGEPRDIAKIFDSVEFAQWRSFRESEDSRNVGLCVPRFLLRLPYGSGTIPAKNFVYEETVAGTTTPSSGGTRRSPSRRA